MNQGKRTGRSAPRNAGGRGAEKFGAISHQSPGTRGFGTIRLSGKNGIPCLYITVYWHYWIKNVGSLYSLETLGS